MVEACISDGYTLIEETKNQCEELVVVLAYRWEGFIILKLKNKANAQNRAELFADTDENGLHINDIHTSASNTGNGSILMCCLLKIAVQEDIKRVYGELSSVDNDHFDRLEHFYSKFGFRIRFNEDRTEGQIELMLPNK